MQWEKLFRWSSKETDPLLKDKQTLVEEIRAAQTDWQHALSRLDYVSDKDQIDYAIFALEAAEKRYEMLLKSAKRLNVHALDIGMGRAAEG
ncbi:DUF2508 family protein [Paenibacillus sp. GYB003]|uniref:DUF2508 family protein n=1 Tax=Paenibacillus sp. GYB003 TaxID=2994392 RepID=UPI002F9628C8